MKTLIAAVMLAFSLNANAAVCDKFGETAVLFKKLVSVGGDPLEFIYTDGRKNYRELSSTGQVIILIVAKELSQYGNTMTSMEAYNFGVKTCEDFAQ